MRIDEPGAGGLSDADRHRIAGSRWAICVGDFYGGLAERLLAGALAGFADGGVTDQDVDVFPVAGAFDLPQVAEACARSGRYAGIACLGVVIRGETSHFDYVCAESARGIQDVALRHGIACGFGVITCDTIEQAEARAGGDHRDAGRHAAVAAMRTRSAQLAAAG